MIMTSGRETGAWADADGRQGAGGAEDKTNIDSDIAKMIWYVINSDISKGETIESISPENDEQKSGKGGRAHSVWVLELLPCDIYLVLAAHSFKYSTRLPSTPATWQGCFCEDLIGYLTKHFWRGALAKHQLLATPLYKTPIFDEKSDKKTIWRKTYFTINNQEGRKLLLW